MRMLNVYSAYFWWHDRMEGIFSSCMFAFPGSSICPFLFVSLHSHSWMILTSLLSLAHVELLPITGNSFFSSMWSMHYFSKDYIYIFSPQEAFIWYWSKRHCCYLTRLPLAFLLGIAFEEPSLRYFLWLCFNLKGMFTNVSLFFYIFVSILDLQYKIQIIL